jgi:hypothetical protein
MWSSPPISFLKFDLPELLRFLRIRSRLCLLLGTPLRFSPRMFLCIEDDLFLAALLGLALGLSSALGRDPLLQVRKDNEKQLPTIISTPPRQGHDHGHDP